MKYFLIILMICILTPAVAKAETVFNPEGLWLTQNQRSVIKVDKCGDDNDALCGKIHWIIDGGMQTDVKNPDSAVRTQKMCGLEIMRDLEQSNQNGNYWLDGKIYKADDGDTYSAKVQMLPDDKMSLRGYRGISLLGKTQTWQRVSAADYPKCK